MNCNDATQPAETTSPIKAIQPETTTSVTSLPLELLQRILSQLPLEDQLAAASVCKQFKQAAYGIGDVSICLTSFRRAQSAHGRPTWRPAKSLIVLWFYRRRTCIRSLAIHDAIKPLSDDSAPALILPLLASNLWKLQLQVRTATNASRLFIVPAQRCAPSTLPLVSLCTQLKSLSLTLMPDPTAKLHADLQWLEHLDLLRELRIELPATSSCALDGLSCLRQLHSVSLTGAQSHHLEDLVVLPAMTSLHLLRYLGTEVPPCLGACYNVQQLTLELHNIPMQCEADVTCLSSLRALTELTVRTSRPARLHVACMKALRAALPDVQRLCVAFCNYHWPLKELPAVVPLRSCRATQGRAESGFSNKAVTTNDI